MTVRHLFHMATGAMLLLLMSACGASVTPFIPTAQPTSAPTLTTTGQALRVVDETPTPTTSTSLASPTSGATPTPLFGAAAQIAELATATRIVNPNAPRIEFFRANITAVAPGGSLTLFWSTRNVDSAVIYRLDATGQRTQVYNVPPDGNETFRTNARDRGQVEYLLSVGEGVQRIEQTVTIALECPIAWFFQPAPEDCPNDEAASTLITEQSFERGRMFYVASTNEVYVLFNDGSTPAWISRPNLYDPSIHPERDENFERALIGTGFVQPVGRLGFLWRGNDTVRNRLGVGTLPETTFDGFIQTAPSGSDTTRYLTSSGGTVLQLLPGGNVWQIITPF